MQNHGKQPFPLHARQLGFPVALFLLLKMLEFSGVIDGIPKLRADGARPHVQNQGDDEQKAGKTVQPGCGRGINSPRSRLINRTKN